MYNIKEIEAEIRKQMETPITYKRLWGHPWYQWRGGVNIPINIISEDEMRKHGLEIGNRRAKAKRRAQQRRRNQFTGWAADYYRKIGEIKAKEGRGEKLSEMERLILARAEVRNI